jgi:DNA-3-methyladenine glycosylase II
LGQISFALDPVPPFRLDLTVWTLRRRSDNIVDRWDGWTYRRALVLHDRPIEVAVTQTSPLDAPRLEVVITGARLARGLRAPVTAALEYLLGIRVDLAAFYRLATHDPRLAPLVQCFRGVKPPRFPTLFEALINAIACQQVTLTQGIRLLNRLTEAYGLPLQRPGTPVHAFPRPEDLAIAAPETLRGLGLSRQKARALIELASAMAAKRLDLDSLVSSDDDATVAQLRQLRGVGRWTAEYVLLRGLGRLHIFPGDDVGARANLERWLHLAEPLDYEGVRSTLATWRPYGGLIYFHLLLDRLAEAGTLTEAPLPTPQLSSSAGRATITDKAAHSLRTSAPTCRRDRSVVALHRDPVL